jgi:hypothetical protein
MSSATQQLQYQAPSHIVEHGISPALVVSGAPLIGTWNNVNAATRDLVKVVIAAHGTAITVNPFGACSPAPCNWGAQPGIAYAANVSSAPAVGFTAAFTFSFARVTVTGHLLGKELIVETFTQFTDGSGRSNYYAQDIMKK